MIITRKYTIEKLISGNAVHVDKTEHIYKLINSGSVYFLSMSRRLERFVFLTGVSQFSGLSIFSGLNNLNNITMDNEYGAICGYTQEELEINFKEYIESTAETMVISKEELLSKIKYWYNGYSWDGKEFVYNPFSMLMFFEKKEIESYWFATGTQTFLIEQIKKKDDLELLIEVKVVDSSSLMGRDESNIRK
ncbi:MAG: AAA family ATPase [Endomicrobium sp.]|nr:AAA family ATPase [Endomicrobium sp.]